MDNLSTSVENVESETAKEASPFPAENVPVQQMAQDEFAADTTEAEQTSDVAQAMLNEKENENIIAGTIGAFVFGLVGGLLYFAIYRFGYIAGICGFITFSLSYWAYRKLSKATYSIKGVIISIIVSLITIFLGEFFGLAYEVYDAFHADYGITFIEAVKLTPEFLGDSEILPSVIRDLAIAYFLGALASFGTIKQAIAANKH